MSNRRLRWRNNLSNVFHVAMIDMTGSQIITFRCEAIQNIVYKRSRRSIDQVENDTNYQNRKICKFLIKFNILNGGSMVLLAVESLGYANIGHFVFGKKLRVALESSDFLTSVA